MGLRRLVLAVPFPLPPPVFSQETGQNWVGRGLKAPVSLPPVRRGLMADPSLPPSRAWLPR